MLCLKQIILNYNKITRQIFQNKEVFSVYKKQYCLICVFNFRLLLCFYLIPLFKYKKDKTKDNLLNRIKIVVFYFA